MKSNKSIFEMTQEELQATLKPSGTWRQRRKTKYTRAFNKKEKSVRNKLMSKDKLEFYLAWINSGERLDELWDRLVYTEARLTFLNRELEEWIAAYREI